MALQKNRSRRRGEKVFQKGDKVNEKRGEAAAQTPTGERGRQGMAYKITAKY